MNPPNWRMPAEFAPQVRCWMGWPSGGYVLGDDEREAEETRTAWAAVANIIAEYEELVMVVDPTAEKLCGSYLSDSIVRIVEPLNDAWMRDFGPSFVVDDTGQLGAVAWAFNGWGAQTWAQWDRDSKIAAVVGEPAKARSIRSTIVNEGGAIHVDGAGTVLATLSVQLDPGRNPGLSAEEIEKDFARTIGATKTVWLPRGLYRDAKPPGTRGHIDMMACFTAGDQVLVHEQPDTNHPDHEIMEVNARLLSEAADAEGKPLEIVRIPAPTVLVDETGDFVDYNYINHLVINGAVIVPAFDDPRDQQAIALLGDLYPNRQIRTVDARAIFRQGGGIHCITQQQPTSDPDH